MKNLVIICIASLILNISCTKKDVEHTTSLPAATQSGANTFGAMVNGVLFTPNEYTGSFSQSLYAYYNPTPAVGDTDFLILNASDLVGSGGSFRIHAMSLIAQGQTYPLQTSASNPISITYVAGNQVMSSVKAPLTGQLTITKLDFQNRIISGTFYFDAINSNGDKVSVTDGRFDVKF